MSDASLIRPARPEDAAGIAAIYNRHVEETVVTFEETPVGVPQMAGRIAEVTQQFPWLTYEENGAVLGYAYATRWKERSAYRFCVETTIYLAPEAIGRGIGTRLYRVLIDELRGRGIHSAIGGIALPNPASVALHEKVGFEPIGTFKEVGWKFGRWVDVGYWELIL